MKSNSLRVNSINDTSFIGSHGHKPSAKQFGWWIFEVKYPSGVVASVSCPQMSYSQAAKSTVSFANLSGACSIVVMP